MQKIRLILYSSVTFDAMNKLLTLLFFPSLLFSQVQRATQQCASVKQNAVERQTRNVRVAFPGEANIDVNYYKIDLNIDPTGRRIAGSSTVGFTALRRLNSYLLDLNNSHQVDSVVSDGKKLPFTHANNIIRIEPTVTIAANEQKIVTVFYQGRPPSNNFGSFEFGVHGPNNFPVVWSLSEPYGAPDWWACKDNPNDKADSSDVWITMPQQFVSVSNGTLTETLDLGNLRTYKWKNRDPIAHYLISVACSNYTQYDNYVRYSPTDSLLISHYVYPENFNAAVRQQLDETVRVMEVLSEKFGQYPFINEKYGHAQCGFGGGMEHQTISSMGNFSQGLVVHELAHQWFGNYVTCKTWADIWVNEGFATYSEALYQEAVGGSAAYNQEITELMQLGKEATGSIFVQNTNSINQIFNFRRTYAKGAVVLHMLRGILGEETFYQALRDYLKQYADNVATIRDFQAVAEATSGKSLNYFFDEWLFKAGYPSYNFGWQNMGANTVEVTVRQTPVNGNEPFVMPVDLKLTFADNSEQTITIFVDKTEETFRFSDLTAEVTDVAFDPENKIMKEVSEFLFVTANEPPSDDGIVLFPNPANDILQLTGVDFSEANVSLFNSAGQAIFTPLVQNKALNISNLNAGKYFLLIRKNGNSKRVVKGFVKR